MLNHNHVHALLMSQAFHLQLPSLYSLALLDSRWYPLWQFVLCALLKCISSILSDLQISARADCGAHAARLSIQQTFYCPS